MRKCDFALSKNGCLAGPFAWPSPWPARPLPRSPGGAAPGGSSQGRDGTAGVQRSAQRGQRVQTSSEDAT